jgi:hypothetical protein
MMTAEEIVATINGMNAEPRIMAGEYGDLPPAPTGYQYNEDYELIPL